MAAKTIFIIRDKQTGKYLENGRIWKHLGHIKLSPIHPRLYTKVDREGKLKMYDPHIEIVEFELVEKQTYPASILGAKKK